jgi:hypothetical protein
MGRAPTDFSLALSEGQRVEFHMPAQHFPRTIAYSLQPDGSLAIDIDGVEHGRSKSENYVLRCITR